MITQTQEKKIIRLPEVIDQVGLSRSVIYDRIKNGDFPKQVKLGKRASGWIENEVQAWIERQANNLGVAA